MYTFRVIPAAILRATMRQWLSPFLQWLDAFLYAFLGGSPNLAVDAVASAALSACTYAAGTLGVGATLTGNVVGAFDTIDGVAPALNNIYLIAGQASQLQNGPYKLTTVGNGGAAFVLTRLAGYDVSAAFKDGTFVDVRSGTVNADTTWKQTSADAPVVGTDAITFARDPGVMTTNTTQTVTAAKTFATATLLLRNAAATFSATFTFLGTQARAIAFPDLAGTLAITGQTTSSTTPTFTGTAATTGETTHSSGTGFGTVGQVVTTTDNHSFAANELAGMWLITASQPPCLIVSNLVCAGAPAVITVYGLAPATNVETYKILRAPTPVGTVSAHTHTNG